ncbi:MAG: TVP38/TMEM64 family protein, partial [Enterococcus sp.]|nr:TVP38/TMEM64 family protein [Enterococcus sp.]
MSKKNKHKFARILLVLVILLAVVGFYFVPGIRSKITQVLVLFRSMSVESIVGYLRSFGVWAVVISFLLMMFQSIIAPLPAFLITFANAA